MTTTTTKLRTLLITKASKVINHDRPKTHGDAREVHARIAALWSTYLDCPIDPADVAMMMVLFKVARVANTPKTPHEDNYVDIIGYAALGGELAIQPEDKTDAD